MLFQSHRNLKLPKYPAAWRPLRKWQYEQLVVVLPTVWTLTLPERSLHQGLRCRELILESEDGWELGRLLAGAIQNMPQIHVLNGQRKGAFTYLPAPIPVGKGVPSGNALPRGARVNARWTPAGSHIAWVRETAGTLLTMGGAAWLHLCRAGQRRMHRSPNTFAIIFN